ncbi:MAG TPA: zeta toxin family protein [Candidatus Paceibacterota bacterium]|nr:zeta toxin family protein [Candidatus Paceibacterota bacterium]
MVTYNSKLIVIRGNSGSGKGTVARKIREASDRNIAIVEQDYLRRFVLKEKEKGGANNIDLIFQTVTFALSREYDVILEGILNFSRYGEILKNLEQSCPDNHFYYLDVSLEESLRRHATKPNAHEFGEKEMTEWYKPLDLTGFASEVVIPETSAILETVQLIREQTGL